MKANIYLGTPLAACPSLLVFPLINLFLRNPQHQHWLGAGDKTQSRMFHVFRTPDRISSTPGSLHPFNPIASFRNSPSPTPTQGCSLAKCFFQHLLLPVDWGGSLGHLRWIWMGKSSALQWDKSECPAKLQDEEQSLID